jgi:hypothetical protein
LSIDTGRRARALALNSERMNQDDFRRLQQLVRDAGFLIVEAVYSRESFGSWYVKVSSTPRRRVIWDGKDGWLIVQEETEERFGYDFVWRDFWIGRAPIDQTCEAALEALRRRAGAA